MRTPAPSPQVMARAGWKRVDPRPWSKCRARWLHVRGWRLEHCGHPTANHPWALYAPAGVLVLAGVQDGFPPDHGHAWDTLGDAIAWIATAPARAFEAAP
jgi:hypothetical protein